MIDAQNTLEDQNTRLKLNEAEHRPRAVMRDSSLVVRITYFASLHGRGVLAGWPKSCGFRPAWNHATKLIMS